MTGKSNSEFEFPITFQCSVILQVNCETSQITQSAVCKMPALHLPTPDFSADATSTPTDIAGAAASFITSSKQAVIYVGVRMNDPRSYRDLHTSLVFYPAPTIYPATEKITVVRGETVTLTIRVCQSVHSRAKSRMSLRRVLY